MKNKKTIFVVEDSLIVSEIIALQVKMKLNCRVIIFNNGDNIFYKINKYLPDLIILDYNFNDAELRFKNGLEVLVELRKNSNVPVLVFSGQRDKEKAIEIIQKGANDYISKDDDDFMVNLLTSIKNVFKMKESKKNIVRLKEKLKKVVFLALFVSALTLTFLVLNA